MLTPASLSVERDGGTNLVNRRMQRPALLLIALLMALAAVACGADSTPDQPTAASDATSTVGSQAAAPSVTIADETGQGGSSSGQQPPSATPLAQQSVPATTLTPLTLPTPRPVEQAPPPVRLRIPSLEIDTAVQWVGVDAEGRMDVPSNYTDVAWYERGPTPGTPGNAVIAGHLDSPTGPAIFYRLKDLQAGDEIITVTDTGQEYRFVVTTSEVYDADDAPLARIFGNAIRPQLNLITCDGAFDRSIRQYDKRLVVFTELATGP